MSSNESNGNKPPRKKKAARKKAARKKAAVKPSSKKAPVKKKAAAKKKTAVKKAAAKKTVAKKPASKKPKTSNSKSKVAVNKRRSMLRILGQVALLFTLIMGGYLIYLDAVIQSKFEGKRWQIPAKVFSRPLELFAGANVSQEQIEYELQQLNYRRKKDPNTLKPGNYARTDSGLQIRTRGFDFWDATETGSNISVDLKANAVDDVIVNGKGDEIARLEPVLVGGIYPAHNEDRVLVTLDQVPSALIGALLAVEDREFYEHWGVSVRGIARALFANIKAGGLRQGGSTLTQQLVKNFYLSSERSLTRKINEALMALLLDFHYEKDDILEAYLNEVYLGQAGQRAIHGFGLASLFYFGVPLRELEVQQIALLVGIVKGASWYDPRRNPERAKERRTQVLSLMLDQGEIGQAEFDRVKNKPLGVIKKPVYVDERYPAFMNLVRQQLKQDYRDEDLRSEGLRIFTTIDPYAQHQLEKTIAKQLRSVERYQGEKYQTLQAASIFTSANTGEVVALVGDKNSQYKGFNRALRAYRPIGSLIKPVVYLSALEKGYTLASLLKDEPIEIKTENGELWRPDNFEKVSHGEVILQQALAHSYNQATASLAMDVGIEKIADRVVSLGVEKDLPKVPALALGAVSLSPFEVATLYQTFAAGGFYTPLRSIRSVMNAEGKPLQRYGIDVEKRISPEHTYLLTAALQEVVTQGTAKTAKRYLSEGLKVAGKTGTSDDQRDAWFAGWSGSYLGVVWVGFDDNLKTELTGATGALPIWAQTMAGLTQVPLKPIQPESVDWYWIDPKEVARSKPHCDGAVFVPMIESTVPTKKSSCSETGRVFNWIRKLFD
ncbi:MAG: penicillin-binding protein 1B [Pseudomonadales bacterium]|nr:penicillin-binding protein 1B [Pseudomonadales bacterium]